MRKIPKKHFYKSETFAPDFREKLFATLDDREERIVRELFHKIHGYSEALSEKNFTKAREYHGAISNEIRSLKQRQSQPLRPALRGAALGGSFGMFVSRLFSSKRNQASDSEREAAFVKLCEALEEELGNEPQDES